MYGPILDIACFRLSALRAGQPEEGAAIPSSRWDNASCLIPDAVCMGIEKYPPRGRG